jgi:hypothetical protein
VRAALQEKGRKWLENGEEKERGREVELMRLN